MARDVELWCDLDLDEVRSWPLAGGRAAGWTHRRPDGEGPNQDGAAWLALEDGRGVLAVADGVGGGPAGAHAAERALCNLRDAVLEAERAGQELRSGILDGFERANRELRASGLGASTTLVVAALEEGAVRPYHAGDSELLVTGQRGRVKLRTLSHSPTGYAVEAGLLDADEALHHDERHFLSNAIGTAEMRIEIGPALALSPRDTLLLASDGLFDNLSVDDVVARVRRGPLEKALTTLVAACQERMRGGGDPAHPSKPDDLTVLAFRPGPGGAGR